jgi:hypothetical protein
MPNLFFSKVRDNVQEVHIEFSNSKLKGIAGGI